MLFANAPADRILVSKHASRRGMDAELMFEAQRADGIARPQPALLVRQEFRDQEE
jgi:hypothetical protein